MFQRGLYAIADVDCTQRAGFAVPSFIRAVLDAQPACLQVRAKSLGAREYLELLETVVPWAKDAHVPVYANDRPDLAWLAGCDGVHVGQTDLPVSAIRRLPANLHIGVSTHDAGELARAFDERPTYVAIGPIYDTASKVDAASSVGLSLLVEAQRLSKRTGIPTVAIGGIDATRAVEVRKYVDSIAVISALFPADGQIATVTRLTRELHELIVAS
jgi:thiamine-phosphate pyrophosphorylase